MTLPHTKALDDQLIELLIAADGPLSLAEVLGELTGHRYGDTAGRLTTSTVYPRLQSLARRGIVERLHPAWAPERVLYTPSHTAREQRAKLIAELEKLTAP